MAEYFDSYQAFDTAEIDESAMQQGLAAERDGYTACCTIVVMSKRAAAYILRHYDIPQGKIHIVPPGANIPERLLEKFEQSPAQCRPRGRKFFAIGFIGLYPQRKGLPTIAEAVQLLTASRI